MSAVPKDWTQWLALASAIHNNRRNSTTSLSPNQILLGYDILLNPELTLPVINETAEERVKLMEQRWAQATAALNETAERSGTLLAQYSPRNQVWLEGKNLRLPFQATKLAPKQYRLFKIIKEISPIVFQLALPLSWKIHNVFHASLLSPYSEITTHRPNFSRPPPDLIGDEAEYKVEQIRNHHYFRQNRVLQYLVKWKGYPESDNMWESAADVHAPDLTHDYHKGTPLKGIKAGRLFAANSITLQSGFSSHLLTSQVKPSGFPMQSPLASSLYHPSIPQVQAQATSPHLSCSHTQTHLLLQGTPLHVPSIGPVRMSAASSSTSSTPTCPMLTCPLNPPTAPLLTLQPPTTCPAPSPPTTPICHPIPWPLYSPLNHPSMPLPSAASPRDWSKLSKSKKSDMGINCSQPKTITSDWKTSLLTMKKATAPLPTATSATSTIQTSKSPSAKACTAPPNGSKWPMKVWCWPIPKSKVLNPTPILSLSMLPPSFRQSPLTPFPNGSISSSSASQPSSTCSLTLPKSWTIGALPPISLCYKR